MDKQAKVYIAGHRGLVGSALWQVFQAEGFTNLIGRSHKELDLTNQGAVERFYAAEKPEYVIVAAARVGGIHANNSRPAEFIYENLMIEANLVHGAHAAGVRKLLFLGSSCIYPKFAPQPMPESALLTGALEPTNEWYAVAKIAGIKLCQAYRRQYGDDFISAMPTNLYGPNDNFHLENSHVIPALIRKFHEAKETGAGQVVCWGTGSPRREFLHSEDLARACLFLLENYSEEEFINVGSGEEISIRDLAALISEIVGYSGEVVWDKAKPDGTPRKLMDSSRLQSLGWRPSIALREGLQTAYQAFLRSSERHLARV